MDTIFFRVATLEDIPQLLELEQGVIAAERPYNDAEIVEIITHVGMNVLTNILGKASRVEIDFPKVELKSAS